MGKNIPIRRHEAGGQREKKDDQHPLRDGQADVLVTVVGTHGSERAYAEVAQIISSNIEELDEGMKVFVQDTVAERMVRDRKGQWGPGSQMVVRVSRNTSEKFSQKWPLWGFFWDMYHTDNVRVVPRDPDDVVEEQNASSIESLEKEILSLVERKEVLNVNDTRLEQKTLEAVCALELLLSEEDMGKIDEREGAAKIALTSLKKSIAILERPAEFQLGVKDRCGSLVERLRASIKKMPPPTRKNGNGSSPSGEEGHLTVTIADIVGDLELNPAQDNPDDVVEEPEAIPA
ncbi:hypothetical protein COT76_02120 [Candidatus Berkelbacteria bacterium CG10_big_fil_rev_8_21_14_0_10_33_10]|nr:MAG: hypothetical protein COT76_02120 [Candidatus Berkelbacteria bacterium CG10_big_fil_rev_8_21_14_0_10_33_10]